MQAARPPVILYGLNLSWYSTKVRAYLRYKGIDFVEKAPTLIDYYIRIKNRFGDPVMPVVITPDGEWVQDSTNIIEKLEALFPQPAIYPSDPLQRFAAYLLEMWADEFWQPQAVHTRWSYPENYPAWEQEARGFLPGFPFFLQRQVAAIPKRMMLDYMPTLGIVPAQVPLLDRWIDDQLDALDAHFATMPYLFGTRASVADFALFGPLDGHMNRDVSSRRPLIESRPNLHAWIQRLSTCKPKPWPGAFIESGDLPETLTPFFRSIFGEMVPYLQAIMAALADQPARRNSGERLPRFTESVSFPFGDGRHFRAGMPYALWMAQRALDLLSDMPQGGAARVRDWADANGGKAFMNLAIPRLSRAGLQTRVTGEARPE